MGILYILLLLIIVSLFVALRKKRFGLLLIPVAAIALFIIVEIILVPAPLLDTLKFIFSLQ